MPDKITRVALYARVSTKMQDAEPQLVRLREWAARQGFEVYMERTDLASGRLVRRSGADEILREARGHHVHAVAVAKVDRWARSLQHLAASIEELHALEVDFYAVDQGLAVRRGDPTAMLILSILGACAQWEASIISERTKEGLRDKIGKGRHRNGCGVEFPCPTRKHPKNGYREIAPWKALRVRGFGNGGFGTRGAVVSVTVQCLAHLLGRDAVARDFPERLVRPSNSKPHEAEPNPPEMKSE